MIKIDVIIPTYNRYRFVTRAIESVLNQTHKNLELYIVDDGSQDRTEEEVQPYLMDLRVHYLKQKNQGVSAARNFGIKSSKNIWVSFLDSDDEWLPHKLETQLKFLDEHPHLRFLHSDEIWIRNGQRVNPPARFNKSNLAIFQRSLDTCLISPSTVMMRRDLLLEHDLFDESFEICEDYDLWLKVLAREEVGFINEHLIKKYGGHDDQLSTRFKAMDDWKIRSLIKLLESQNLSTEKEKLIRLEIQKKATVLLAGFLKHNHLERHQELTKMLNRIKPLLS